MDNRETVKRQTRRRSQLVIDYGTNGSAALKPEVRSEENLPVLLRQNAPVSRKAVKIKKKPKLFTACAAVMMCVVLGLMVVVSYVNSNLAVVQKDILSTQNSLDKAVKQQKKDLLDISIAQNIDDMKAKAGGLGFHYPEAGQVQSISVAKPENKTDAIKDDRSALAGDETDYLALIAQLLD